MLYISPVAAACKNSCDASEGLVHFSSDSHSAPQAAMAWSTNASGAGGRGVDVAAARFGGGVAVGGGGLVGRVVADGCCGGGRVGVAVAVAVWLAVSVRVGVGVCGASDVASSIAASVRSAAAVASNAVAVAKLAVCRFKLSKIFSAIPVTMANIRQMPKTHAAICRLGLGVRTG